MNDESKKTVDALIKKAGEADNAANALHYSQAAVNAANAITALANLDKPNK